MSKKPRRKRIPFATTLSPEALAALEELAIRGGLSRSGVLEGLIRERARAEGIKLEGSRKKAPR